MNEKKVLKSGIALCLLMLIAHSGRSQITISLEGASTFDLNNDFDYLNTELRLYSWISLNQHIDLEIIALTVDNAIGQILVGPGVPLFGNLRFTGQVGIATNAKNPLRMAGSLSYVVPDFVGVMLYEWGPETSYFYKYLFIYTLDKWDLGIRGQRFRNNGIFFGYKLNEHLQAYLHPGYDFEFDRTTAAFGLIGTFTGK